VYPYARPGIGSIEDLDAATIDDVRAFHATYYRPDNAILVVAGNFDPAQLDRVRSHRRDLERHEALGDRVDVVEHVVEAPGQLVDVLAVQRGDEALVQPLHEAMDEIVALVLDVVDAEHDGYERLADPVRCRRRVVFVKPHGWLVIDELSGATEHDVEVTFQCGPDIRIDHGPDSWLRARTPGGRALWLRAWASSPVVTEVRCGEQDPICGWTSADYGQRQPAPAVVLTARPALPWRVVTALVPADCVSDLAPPVQVHGVHEGPAHASFGMSGPSVRIDAHAIVLT